MYNPTSVLQVKLGASRGLQSLNNRDILTSITDAMPSLRSILLSVERYKH